MDHPDRTVDAPVAHPATRPCSFDGTLTLTGRLLTASNATFVGTVETAAGPVEIVHKPIRGERELWDFPTGTLALREVAAHRVSAAGGFDVVPYTALVDGPFGPGSVQRWVAADDQIDDLVDVVPPTELTEGWFPVLEGESADGEPVLVAHADDPRLRTIAVFDALVNNADRKAGHILRDVTDRGGPLLACDHGVSFHTDDKLRTLLWGWAGQPLEPQEQAMVVSAIADLDALVDLLAEEELEALRERGARLLDEGLPLPPGRGPAVPWPLW